MRFIGFIVLLVVATSHCYGQELKPIDVTLMTWNILAPIWIDRPALSSHGAVDMNLLNDEIRLKLVVMEIMNKSPDILTLQEVQEDVFNLLVIELSSVYSPAAFASYDENYWRSYLPEGVGFEKNGVATFFNKKKFNLKSQEAFSISDNGNFALAVVLRPISENFAKGRKVARHPLVVINCHLESGFSEAESYQRVLMGNVVMDKANQISSLYSKHEKPIVIIAGDLNSQAPFPGFSNFQTKGYLDAFTELDQPITYTFFYEAPVPLPGTDQRVPGTTLDHVFIRSSDKQDGRIKMLSVEVQDILSDELLEGPYVQKIEQMLNAEFKDDKIDSLKATLNQLKNDGLESDAKVNRALRLGSDHLHVFVTMQVAV